MLILIFIIVTLISVTTHILLDKYFCKLTIHNKLVIIN